MHYSDGREAKVGDVAKVIDQSTGGTVVGVVIKLTPGAETCNGTLDPKIRVAEQDGRRVVVGPPNYDVCFTVGEAQLVL